MAAIGIVARVRVKDNGFNKLAKELAVSGDHGLQVGVIGKEADEPHGTLTNAQVATIHEFGTDRIPERSFLRATVDEKTREIQDIQRKIARGIIKNKITEKRGLDLLGLFIVGAIQGRIAAGIAPALKPATIARKGSSTPLIDTGQLRQSIKHEVTRTGRVFR